MAQSVCVHGGHDSCDVRAPPGTPPRTAPRVTTPHPWMPPWGGGQVEPIGDPTLAGAERRPPHPWEPGWGGVRLNRGRKFPRTFRIPVWTAPVSSKRGPLNRLRPLSHNRSHRAGRRRSKRICSELNRGAESFAKLWTALRPCGALRPGTARTSALRPPNA
jgi:hypothetical protein